MLPELAGNTVLGWFVCLFFFEREVVSDAVRTIRLSFKISLSYTHKEKMPAKHSAFVIFSFPCGTITLSSSLAGS